MFDQEIIPKYPQTVTKLKSKQEKITKLPDTLQVSLYLPRVNPCLKYNVNLKTIVITQGKNADGKARLKDIRN